MRRLLSLALWLGMLQCRTRDVHRWYEAHGYDFIVFTDHSTSSISQAADSR